MPNFSSISNAFKKVEKTGVGGTLALPPPSSPSPYLGGLRYLVRHGYSNLIVFSKLQTNAEAEEIKNSVRFTFYVHNERKIVNATCIFEHAQKYRLSTNRLSSHQILLITNMS